MTPRIVHVAVFDTLADWEVGAATAHINNDAWHRVPGAHRTRTVGLSTDPVTTMGGMRIVPDTTLAELTPADSAMLILPGATGWELGELDAFAEKARGFAAAGVPVAAICGATFGLARAGLLDDRRHTSNVAEFLAASGYAGGDHYVDEPAVTDRGVITANSTAPFEFAREVLAALEIYEPEVLDGWYRLFSKGDPAGYAALAEYEARQAAV
ncbi:type 1 glutamine amidotransferase family protein [Nocardia testacea]|uniref:Type 1 glutamine amidotransferase family protein n=1 Tax=Nocardia testacea TaxID=248551 RepID=A0ABW7VNT8_9NOCA